MLCLLVYSFFSSNNDKAEAGDITVGPGGETVVVITDRGYKPQNLTVKTGSQVKWVNGGQRAHFVTFKLDYSLENISVIDQNLDPKESLTFKFEKAGKFAYFDKNDRLTGTIEVQ